MSVAVTSDSVTIRRSCGPSPTGWLSRAAPGAPSRLRHACGGCTHRPLVPASLPADEGQRKYGPFVVAENDKDRHADHQVASFLAGMTG